jgi:hypothetical protein
LELEPINDWLWCLRTPIVQAYAVREHSGFNLIDASTAGEEDAILEALATIDRQAPDGVRVHDHCSRTGTTTTQARPPPSPHGRVPASSHPRRKPL